MNAMFVMFWLFLGCHVMSWQAKSELGVFSEDGVEETRDLFWRKVCTIRFGGRSVSSEPLVEADCVPLRVSCWLHTLT